MAPGIALEAMPKNEKGLRILDPMMGSGTVLAVARSKGHKAIGIDIDPLAVLIARVWTRAIDAAATKDKATQVLARARMNFSDLPARNAYPIGADDETKKFARFWFDDYSRRQLSSLALAISRVRDPRTRDVLWCAFSRLIITKQAGASLAMDLSHSRPHRAFLRAPAKPFSGFVASVERVVKSCIDLNERGTGPDSRTIEGDARDLPIPKESIDLVLTSPPYLNAIDYLRCSKFSLIWMGYSISTLRLLRSQSVGSQTTSEEALANPDILDLIERCRLRSRLNSGDTSMLARYIMDMRSALSEVNRVLRSGGRAIYVVGENSLHGTYIPNSRIITSLAEVRGFTLESRQTRSLPANRRYLPPPESQGKPGTLEARIRREVVLEFEKP